MAELPYDVFHSLLLVSSLSHQDLKSLCLASKALVEPVQRILFADISLDGDRGEGLDEVLNSSPHLAKYIRTVRVGSGYERPYLPQLLLKIQDMRQLLIGTPASVFGRRRPYLAHWANIPPDFVNAMNLVLQKPSLLVLTIQHFTFPSRRTLACLLGGAHKGLRDLTLYFVGFENTVSEESSSIPPALMFPTQLTLILSNHYVLKETAECFTLVLPQSQSKIIDLTHTKVLELVIHGGTTGLILPLDSLAHFTHKLRISPIGLLCPVHELSFHEYTALNTLALDYCHIIPFNNPRCDQFPHSMRCLDTFNMERNGLQCLKLRWPTVAIPMARGRETMPNRDPTLPQLSFAQLQGCEGWEMHHRLASIIARKFPHLRRLEIKLVNGMTREKGVCLRNDFATVLRGIWEEDGAMGRLDWSINLESN